MGLNFLKKKKKTDELKEQIISSPITVIEAEIEEKAPLKKIKLKPKSLPPTESKQVPELKPVQPLKSVSKQKQVSKPEPLSKIIPKAKVESFIPKLEKSKPPKLASFEKPKSTETIQVVEGFLSQLAKEIGRNNVYEIVKMKKTKSGWNALTRINGDLYTFKLNANGNVLSYEDLSSQ